MANIKKVLDGKEDGKEVKTKGELLKQIFLEILFTKYGAQSLEHVTRGIERVKPILMEHYWVIPEPKEGEKIDFENKEFPNRPES